MSSSSNNQSGGVTFLGALGLLFIDLRLGHVIAWSWWWVTLPLWGWAAVAVALGAVMLTLHVLKGAWIRMHRRRAIAAARSNPVASRRTPISERKDAQ